MRRDRLPPVRLHPWSVGAPRAVLQGAPQNRLRRTAGRCTCDAKPHAKRGHWMNVQDQRGAFLSPAGSRPILDMRLVIGGSEWFVLTIGTTGFFLIAYKITESNLDNALSIVGGACALLIPIFSTGRTAAEKLNGYPLTPRQNLFRREGRSGGALRTRQSASLSHSVESAFSLVGARGPAQTTAITDRSVSGASFISPAQERLGSPASGSS